jgi:hypothetical protein
MKTLTLRNSNEALVAAVAALSLFSAVVTITLAPRMAQAAYVADSRAVAIASASCPRHRVPIAGGRRDW